MSHQAVRQEAFEDLQLTVIEQNGEEWFSAEDIGKALGLADPRPSIIRIFNRHREEFEGLYRVANLTTRLISGGFRPSRFTTFNPQGAYLLAILARTEKSKALRRWLARFMAKDLNRLKEHLTQCEAQHEADQKLIAELQVQVQAKKPKPKKLRLEDVTWDNLEEPSDWFWSLNAQIKGMEKRIMELETRKATLLTVSEDLVLIPARDLRRLKDLAAQTNPTEAQRLFYDVLTAQSEWDALMKRLNRLELQGEFCVRYDVDKLKLN